MFKNWLYILAIFILTTTFFSCGQTDVDSVKNADLAPTVTPTPEGTSDPLSWSGLDSIELIAGDSFKLLWTDYSGASDNYKIYSVTGGSGSLLDTVSGDSTAYTFTEKVRKRWVILIFRRKYHPPLRSFLGLFKLMNLKRLINFTQEGGCEATSQKIIMMLPGLGNMYFESIRWTSKPKLPLNYSG